MCTYTMYFGHVRIEDEERYIKKGGDERAKSRPGNETAGGIRTKFTRIRPRDVFHERHTVRYSEKKKVTNSDTFFMAIELRIIIKFF